MAASNNRERWEAVRNESDLAKAVHMLADLGEEAVTSSVKDREEMRVQLLTLVKILAGNGDPSHSLINRVDDVEHTLVGCKTVLDSIQALIIGDIRTGVKDPSLIERIKDTEKIARTAVKLAWIVLGVVITQIVANLINLL